MKGEVINIISGGVRPSNLPITFTFMHSADASIQVTYSTFGLYIFCQYVCSLGIETHNLCAANAMLYHWATWTHIPVNKNSLLPLPLLVVSASLHLLISSLMHIYFIYPSVYGGGGGYRSMSRIVSLTPPSQTSGQIRLPLRLRLYKHTDSWRKYYTTITWLSNFM